MRYIIMCGGDYYRWETPRQLVEINGEPIVARTIRLLKENGIDDIAISSRDTEFSKFGVPLCWHNNPYTTYQHEKSDGTWCDGFYPTEEPVCYIFGDVVFSKEAIKKIVETDTTDIEFFASAPPFDSKYKKKWAEPFAFKVVNQKHLRQAISLVKIYDQQKLFKREPIAWELWQVIKKTPINVIDYNNYTVINDWTCDIEEEKDIKIFERILQSED